MVRLELFLLGPPRLERDGVPLQFDTRKIMALVAYLAVSGLDSQDVRISRDSLLALLLADQGLAERAVEVYACASRYEFVTNSRWFEDMVGRQISSAAAQLPGESVEAAKERGQTWDWKEMAAKLTDEL